MKVIRTVMVRNCRGITGMTGGETYLLQLLKGFDPASCNCLLVCIVKPSLGETPWLKELKKSGFEYVTIPIENPFNFKDIVQLVTIIKQFNADIVHALDHRANLVSLVGARLSGRPVIASFLGWVNFPKGSWRSFVYPWIDRLILKRLDAVITDSVAIGEELKMHENDPPIVAIRNGIDTQHFDPNKQQIGFSNQSFIQQADFVFGMVGRIHPVKGHFNFLSAAHQILQTNPNFRFLITGTVLPGFEDYKQKILDFIDQHKMTESVMITEVKLEEIPSVFASLDVLVAPSYAESFSFTLLEGMAMEKAVITSDVGGACEMIQDGETGYLIDIDDVKTLTERMLMLSQHPEKIQQLGKKARQKIIKDLGIEVMARLTTATYEHLIEYKHSSGSKKQKIYSLKQKLAKVSAK